MASDFDMISESNTGSGSGCDSAAAQSRVQSQLLNQRNLASKLAAEGMYHPQYEHDSCGVGLVAATDGKASRRVVDLAIEALGAVWHRGAVDADGKTGDGAGILVDLPVRFFDDAIAASGHKVLPNRLAVGMVFLPRADLAAQESCRMIVEAEVIRAGFTIYGWRPVAVDISVIGDKARQTRPAIEQIMIAGPLPNQTRVEEYEKHLYLVRRRIEKRIAAAQIPDFYICSLSCRSIIYKGLFLAESLADFYPDLRAPLFESRMAIFHQRYSTNTFPQWWLAQPFRCLAHNGEINTIRGNKNWMMSHENKMASLAFGDASADIKPLIPAGASDTAALDAVFEALCRAERDAPTARLILIPQAWNNDIEISPAHRDMYSFFASLMEPWDGPAALAMSDGRWAVAGMDRNALRPLRYTETRDNLLIVGSESGMVALADDTIRRKGQLGPGQMIAVDLDAGRLYDDHEIKDHVASQQDYARLVKDFRTMSDLPAVELSQTDSSGEQSSKPLASAWQTLASAEGRGDLLRRQIAAGLSMEDMELILAPMVAQGKEAIGSMGDDTPLAVISARPRHIAHFFRQNFSQVTNPPIDSLRERHVMSLNTRFGNLANILDPQGQNPHVLVIDSPILVGDDWDRLRAYFGDSAADIDCSFARLAGSDSGGDSGRSAGAGAGAEGSADNSAEALDGAVDSTDVADSAVDSEDTRLLEDDIPDYEKQGGAVLRAAIADIRAQAEAAVRGGCSELFLTDEHIGADRVGIAMILATAAVHTHLVRKGLRSYASINVRSAEALDTHSIAVLIGVGATTVHAYLAEAAIVDRQRRGLFGDLSREQCRANYRHAVDEGLLKILSKMGIAVISSYRGGYNFEALGLSRALADDLFPGMPNKISGEGYQSLYINAIWRHRAAYGDPLDKPHSDSADGASDRESSRHSTDGERTNAIPFLPVGGLYRQRAGGEPHAYSADMMQLLQTAVASDSYSTYQRFSKGLAEQPPIYLRDLMEFQPARDPIAPDSVEAITKIRQRFVTPGMSLGALSPEAHETLAIAMNRIGAKAVSGEGGEDKIRYKPYANGNNANSSIKQIASGRFGVTAEYLGACEEIEIKVAQGAKPGEGGQLPGFKVNDFIARLRHATAGVTLISPPPHHDIYSIEDLAQLIYDLKQINPRARVCVKLVSAAGIGTIAAGVAKAHADVILISGNVGGTGASPQTSIKYAGTPWEMGLAEVNQLLMLNGLRDRITLRVDGGLKTGRDIVIAALLGAEEYGIGTLSLVAMGCIMVRQCHSNTCPVGICTQDERLRAKFAGTPEKVVNLMTFIAEEVRGILAELGAHSLDEIIGQADLLRQVSRGAEHLDDLDLNPILLKVDAPQAVSRSREVAESKESAIESKDSAETTGATTEKTTKPRRNPVPDGLDAQILRDAKPLFAHRERMQLTYNVRNTHRTVGTRLSAEITERFGMQALSDDHVHIRLRGTAGQSLGAFLCQGVTLEIFGDANDYVGKGLSGGKVILRPKISSNFPSQANSIIGNVALYGATAGSLFAAGQAGERFAVRNSGACAVIEGCGANGCEYMTGGMAVILGAVGSNFGAGMTGGMAFVLDIDDMFERRANGSDIIWQRLASSHWEARLYALVEEHARVTNSDWAHEILKDWAQMRELFWQVCPKEMEHRLDHPLTDEEPRYAVAS